MRILLPVAIALAVPACLDELDTTSRHQPVIGGSVTPEGLFPGVGALYLASQSTFSCTGTLIAPDVVLTAGHCVEPLLIGSEVPGFTLAHDTTAAPPVVVATAQAIQHEQFNIMVNPGPGVGDWYDIALLILDEPITSVAPVRLPSLAEAAQLAVGSEMVLVGYGVTTNGGSDGGVMYDALTDLVLVGNSELQISTAGAPQNCYGDSGGPALFDVGGTYRVVGVVSRDATGTGQCTGGGVDTRVDHYLDWIEANAPQVCTPGEACTPATPDAAPPDAAPEPDAGGPGIDDDGGGCCSTGGGAPGGSVLLALVVGAIVLRRRRR